jgi:hypothetical protein
MRGLTAQQQLIAELEAAAARIDSVIAGLTDEQASRPAADGWSVKDQLTHITFWHEMRFFETSRIARGGRAGFQETEEDGLEQMNRQMVENRRGLPLSQVMDDLRFVREMVKQAIVALPEEILDRAPFAEIGPNGAGHEMDHADLIEAWRKQEGI